MNWRTDMENAPVDRHVQVGRWWPSATGTNELVWQCDVDIVLETEERWWGGNRVALTYAGKRFSHWRHLPPPPEAHDRPQQIGETP